MPFFENKDDLGAATAGVLLATIVIGAFIYGYNRVEELQTALNIPSVEKIMPTIPSLPQLR